MHILPVIKGRYVKGKPTKATGTKLSNHMKYMQNRPRGEEETREDRALFSQESDHIQRRNAVDDMMDHTSRNVNYHVIILSPAEHEHIDDFRQWTRDVMDDLQEKKGVQLHWYAVVHAHERENTTEPHVHLVLAGTGEDLHTGQLREVRMTYDQDYKFMREQGREHSNYEFYQEVDRVRQQLDHEDNTMTQADHQHDRQEEYFLH